MRSRVLLGLLVLLAACAPTVDGPAAEQRARDREDEAALAAQLGALPGVTTTRVAIHRAARDPLAPPAPVAPPLASILVVTEGGADRAHVLAAAETLARATLPDVPIPTIVVEAGAPRPELADVGPFTVVASSRGPLRIAIALALVLIASLALAVAYFRRADQRRGTSTQ